jgi:outer membrane protein
MRKKRGCIFTLFIGLVCLSANAQNTWSLKACVDTAFKKNISLNQEQLASQINKIYLTRSRAALFPNLNLNDLHSLHSGSVQDPYTYQYTKQSISTNDLSLNSSVTLFNGYLLLNTVKQNKLIYEAGMLDVEKTKNDILLNVVAGYMQVLMDYEAIREAQDQVAVSTTQVAQIKQFVDFGKLAELSLLQIQSQLASDKLIMVNAENQLQLDKLTLLQLMEIPIRNDFDIQRMELNELFPETPMSTEEIDKISENFLPQIKSASQKTDASLYSLKMAESGRLPKLTLGGAISTGYSSAKTDFYMNQFKNNVSQQVSLTLAVPIFNNLMTKSNVAIAKINVQSSQWNEQQTKNDVRKNIEMVYTNQVMAGKKLIATQEQMELEKRTYFDMEKKFNVGTMGATDFLIEKNNYNKVAMLLIQAKYDYVLKAKMVDFYLGKPLTF